VTANRDDRGRVGCIVALEDDTATVGQVFEDVRRGVLVDAHDVRAAGLHCREVSVRPPAGRA